MCEGLILAADLAVAGEKVLIQHPKFASVVGLDEIAYGTRKGRDSQ